MGASSDFSVLDTEFARIVPLTSEGSARYHEGMTQRSRLLIYERKELVLLGVLALLVALFAFTFGIHVGKRVPPRGKPTPAESSAVGSVKQISDQAPTRAEAQEKVDDAAAVTTQILDEELKEEVSDSGVQLEKPVQMDLPKTTVAEKRAAEKKAEKPPASEGLKAALVRPAPRGAFTVQILAAPIADGQQLEKAISRLEKSGLEPWVRRAEIPGKGSWYRIYQGGFASREIAEKVASEWKASGKIDSYVVTKAPTAAAGENHNE